MTTIPASELVAVNPSVLAVSGSALDVVGLLLSTNTRVPTGTVQSFPDAASVGTYFGSASDEATFAANYFQGFDGSSKKPASLLIAQYNTNAVSAYLRGGNVSALTLAQLQALSGSLSVVFDGVTFPAPSVVLSPATGFSSAAGIIGAALAAAAPAAASVTGSIGGIVTASAGAVFTATGSGTNLTTSAVTGVIHIGATITGVGVPAGTYIVSQTSGTTGGAGVYVTNNVTTSAAASLTATSNTLDVTAVTSGTLQASDVISGTGITVGTTILAQISGTPGGIGLYTISVAQRFAPTATTALSTVLNVTAVGSGTLVVGATLSGTNVAVGTTITAQITGVGLTGTYRVSLASTTVSETITSTSTAPTVTYDSTSGAFVLTSGITGAASSAAFATGTIAAGLKLTSATGAVLSQGAAPATPAAFMANIINVTTDWVTFTTLFDPDGGSGNTLKQQFAAWKNTQNNRYGYVCWDTDITPTVSVPAAASLGALLPAAGDSGTALIWAPDITSGWKLAAFVCGAGASINFTEHNGRITFAYKSQAGLLATVTTAAIANNLGGDPQTSNRGNGYSFYGAYAQANARFIWFQRGFVTGAFLWFDSYINQIWLNNSLQNDMLVFMQNARSIPYNAAGNSQIEAALGDSIAAGLNFGAYAPGRISAAQIAAINTAAGGDIAGTLQTQGYYLQVLPADSATRVARASPPIKFWYLDRGSVQAISINSIAVQ